MIKCPQCDYEFEPEKTETVEEPAEEEIEEVIAEEEATEEFPEETDKVKEYVEIITGA